MTLCRAAVAMIRWAPATLALSLATIAGCGSLDVVAGRAVPDTEAITVVGEDAYRMGGRARRVVFFECPGTAVKDAEVAAARVELERRLGLAVRSIADACFPDSDVPALTPVLCDTGDVGTEITLRWFESEPGGVLSLQASIGYSGLDGMFIRYRLRPSERGWEIVEREYLREIP